MNKVDEHVSPISRSPQSRLSSPSLPTIPLPSKQASDERPERTPFPPPRRLKTSSPNPVSAAGILLLRLLVEGHGLGAEIVTLVHQTLQGLPAIQDIFDVLVHDVFDLVQVLQKAGHGGHKHPNKSRNTEM